MEEDSDSSAYTTDDSDSESYTTDDSDEEFSPEEPRWFEEEKYTALDKLTAFMALDLLRDERTRFKCKAFKKMAIRRMKFNESEVAPVVEKIKKKYSSGQCPECARRYQLFEAVVLRGEDPAKAPSLRHVCSGSARLLQRRQVFESYVKPSSVEIDPGIPSDLEERLEHNE